jgi:predicted nuclease with RNAse H fold
MANTRMTYVGIDPTAGSRPMHFAALDRDLHIQSLTKGNLQAVLESIQMPERAVVAIDAPQSPNQGLMADPGLREGYGLPPNGDTWSGWKVCEYELRRRNIRLYRTPREESEAPRWIRMGFTLFRRLKAVGFELHERGRDIGQRALLEVHPHACFAVILGRRPFLKSTLEGRLQRQLVLYLEGVDVPDPMRSLEEITRHHLLESRLSLPDLYHHDELDALVAAYTAFLVSENPERITQVGDREEGLITLPTGELLDFYR